MGRQIETMQTEMRVRSIMARFLTKSPTEISEQMDRVYDQQISVNTVKGHVARIRKQDQEVFSSLASGGLVRLATDETVQINEEIADTKKLIDEAAATKEIPQYNSLHKTLLDLRERRQVVLQNMIVYPHLQRAAQPPKPRDMPIARIVKEAAVSK